MWWRHVWHWLRQQYDRTSIPVLIVGVLTLSVSIANYWIQKNAYDRPELAAQTGQMRLDLNPKQAVFQFTNIGKKPARNAALTLFIVGDGLMPRRKVGQAPVEGIGNIIATSFGSTARIILQEDNTEGPFVACVVYDDEKGEQYHQAFHYRRDAGPPSYVPLDLLPPPKYVDVCS